MARIFPLALFLTLGRNFQSLIIKYDSNSEFSYMPYQVKEVPFSSHFVEYFYVYLHGIPCLYAIIFINYTFIYYMSSLSIQIYNCCFMQLSFKWSSIKEFKTNKNIFMPFFVFTYIVMFTSALYSFELKLLSSGLLLCRISFCSFCWEALLARIFFYYLRMFISYFIFYG